MKFEDADYIEFPEPYGVCDNHLGYYVAKKDGEDFIELCNFVPYISSQISTFDGYDRTTKVKISGFDSKGELLPEITVSNDEFDKMIWIRQNWSFDCNIVPGNGIKDKIRYCIQSTSKYADKIEDYSTTGWYKKNDDYVFLMPGDSDNEVHLEANYRTISSQGRSLPKRNTPIFL